MPPPLAVVDLGTNTFHLLIVRATDEATWEPLYRERIFVDLAEESISRIGAQAWERGRETMGHFERIIESYEAEVKAVGTAALRRASNAADFVQSILHDTGIIVDVISGEDEARYIAAGVLSALPDLQEPILIMDIGGGSVEFVLVSEGKTLHSGSYELGVAVLYEEFHDTEPLSEESLGQLDAHLTQQLDPLLKWLRMLPNSILVGASGTFEVIDHIVHRTAIDAPYSTFARSDFLEVYETVVKMNLEERLAHPRIPDNRARYIVTALHLIYFQLGHVHSDTVYTSSYAMKEGIIDEWLKYLDLPK